MKLKFCLLILATGALGSINVGRMGPREIDRLVKTVNPPTCRCDFHNRCQITIPDVTLIGIQCHRGTVFCCDARRYPKPFLGPSDWAELHATVKRLKVEQQVMQYVVNRSPEEVQAFISNDANQEDNDSEETVVTTPITTSTTGQPTTLTAVPLLTKECRCVEAEECQHKNAEFSLGLSCTFGQTECCGYVRTDSSEVHLETTTLAMEDQTSPEPTTTTTTTIAPTTAIVDPPTTTPFSTPLEASSTTTALPMTTTIRENLENHRLSGKPSTQAQPNKFFFRYSLPTVLTKRPPSFYNNLNVSPNKITPEAKPKYQPAPSQLNPFEERLSGPIQSYKMPVQNGEETDFSTPATTPTPTTPPQTKLQNRNILVADVEEENVRVAEEQRSNSNQETAYRDYVAQIEFQKKLSEIRRQQEEQARQSTIFGQLQKAFVGVSNGLLKYLG